MGNYAMILRIPWLPLLACAALGLNLSACSGENEVPAKDKAAMTEQANDADKGSNSKRSEGEQPSTNLNEQAVRDRATAYLEAIRVNDLAGAFHMESGSLDGSLSALRFREELFTRRGSLIKYQISAVTIEGDEALVEAEVILDRPPMRKPYHTTNSMRWIVRDGKLYHKSPPPKPAELGLPF
jgi:hypothetical protein